MADRPDTSTAFEPASDPARWAPRLRRILDAQAALYETLDQLSASQRALIDADDTDGLLRLLADRQAALDRLGRSNEELAPFRARWSELMDGVDGESRAEFEARVGALAERVGRIAQRDEDDRRALAERRTVATTQIARLARSRSALGAYGGRGGRGPTYQDREG